MFYAARSMLRVPQLFAIIKYKMGSKIKSFWIANFILTFIFISAVVFAWNNPPGGAPPTGSGAIATDAAYNVGIGTAAPSGKLTVRRSAAGTAISVRDTADASDVFVIKDTGQVGAGIVPGGTTRLGLGATAAYIWPLYITTTDGTGRVAGINFSQAAGLTDSVQIGAASAGHRLRLLAGGASQMQINSSGRVGIGPTAASLDASSARLSIIDPNFPTVPVISPTIALFGSSDGTAGGSSIRAFGTVYAGGVILTESAFSSKLADVAEYVRVEGGAAQYAQGDILTIAPAEDLFKKSEVVYDKKLAGVVSTTGGVLLGSEGIEKNEKGELRNHVQLALAGRVPVKVVGLVAIGDAITSSDIPGVGMAAKKSGRVVGLALESWNGEGVGYVKLLVDPHYWVAE